MYYAGNKTKVQGVDNLSYSCKAGLLLYTCGLLWFEIISLMEVVLLTL